MLPVRHFSRSRFRSWLLRGLAALAVASVAALAAGLVLVLLLDRPWVKARVCALVRAKTGLDIDYAAVRVHGASGVDIDELVLRSPDALRAFAPLLARIERLRLRWSLGAWRGGGPAIRELSIENARLDVVVDEHGASSFDALLPRRAPTPATPWSRLPAELFEETRQLGAAHIADLTLTLVRTAHEAVVERDTLEGLSLDVSREMRAGSAVLRLELGRAEAPLELRLAKRREGNDGEAVARAWLRVQLSPGGAELALDVRVLHQDLAPPLKLAELAHVEAQAASEPRAARTSVTLSRLELGGDVATAEGTLDVPDRALPLVRHAAGHVDLGRLASIVPSELLPARLERGQLSYGIDELALEHPAAAKSVVVEGDLENVSVSVPSRVVRVRHARLSLHLSPRDHGATALGRLSVDDAELEAGASRLRGQDIVLTLDAQRDEKGALSGKTELRFGELSESGVASVRTCAVSLEARGLLPDTTAPLRSRGDLSLAGTAQSLEALGGLHTTASALTWKLHLPLSGTAPLAAAAEVGFGRLQVSRADGHGLVDTKARATLALSRIVADIDRPERTEGAAELELDAGALSATCRVSKHADALDYELVAREASLNDWRAFLPDDIARRLALGAMGLEVHSKGSILRPFVRDAELRQKAEVRLTNLRLDAVSARELRLDVQSTHGAREHDARFTLDTDALTVGGTALGADHLSGSLALDRTRSSAHFNVSDDGASKTELSAALALDRHSGAVAFTSTGHVSRLAPLSPLASTIPALAAWDLSALEISWKSQGSVGGLLAETRAAEAPRWSADSLEHAAGSASLELGVSHARWSRADTAVEIPEATWHVTLEGDGTRRVVDGELGVSELRVGSGRRHVTVTGLSDRTEASSTGGLLDGAVQVSEQATIRSVDQNIASLYPLGALGVSMQARREPNGLIKVNDLRIDNQLGGTQLRVQGGIELGGDKRRLSLRASVRQDLGRVSKRRDRFVGRGNAAAEIAVDSADLHAFHSVVALSLAAADAAFPGVGIELSGMDGELPVVSDFTLGPGGFALLRDAQLNPYATLRFADQHPLLTSQSFLSIAKLKTPFIVVAPFAANLAVEQNVVTLAQIEMGVRGGSVTGDGLLEWKGPETRLHADVHASGVQSSHGEPFDGNASLVVDFGDRSIEGRADIVRIGQRHLLDLLDFEDPHRENPAINRIRSALAFGYPEAVHLSFQHGFASAGVELGGLASVMSISDVRGIPLGPLVDRVMSSLQPEAEP